MLPLMIIIPFSQFQLMMDCSTDQSNSAIQEQGCYYFDSNRESNSCLARSYRSYYPTRFPETVSFQWEMRPGLPKKLPAGETDDIIDAIPLSPPPAIHGLGLMLPRPRPRPDINYHRSTSQSHRWTARFWRRISSAAGKTCSSSSSSADRRVPISSDLRQLYDNGVVAALAEGSSSSNSSFLSANRIQPFQCCDEKEGILVRRCSSAGEYYCGGTGEEGIPFNWEMQPGKSKDPGGDADEIEIIPPPTPPPALQSRGLPMPRFDDDPPVPESKKNASCFKYRTGSEQPPFCCGRLLFFGHGRRRRRDSEIESNLFIIDRANTHVHII